MEIEAPAEEEFNCCPSVGLIWTTDVVPPPVRKLLIDTTLGKTSIAIIIARNAAMMIAARILARFLRPLPGSGVGSYSMFILLLQNSC